MSDGWVASDATRHTLSDKVFSPVSLVSVAVAVDDREQFDEEYKEIVREKCKDYDIPFVRPVVKDEVINKYVPEWEQKEARRDIVQSLLTEIESLSNVHFTETTLGKVGDEIIPSFLQETGERKLISPQHLRDEIFPYYNLVSIWDYFERIDEHFQHPNVLVDDFDGKESVLWREIGEQSEQLEVVPKGDRIYPLLSLADLTMEYIKQEITDWSDDNIFSHLTEVAPADKAYVKSYSIDDTKDLKKFAPISKMRAKTQLHYPHPVVFIATEEYDQKEVKNLDVYDVLCELAYNEGGCLKFFDENSDGIHLRKGDILVLDESAEDRLSKYTDFNDERRATTMTFKEVIEEYREG